MEHMSNDLFASQRHAGKRCLDDPDLPLQVLFIKALQMCFDALQSCLLKKTCNAFTMSRKKIMRVWPRHKHRHVACQNIITLSWNDLGQVRLLLNTDP